MKRIVIIMVMLALLPSCTFVAKQKDVKILNKTESVGFSNSFYLNYPKNGLEKTYFTKSLEENRDSAKEVVKTFKDIFYTKFGNISVSEVNLDLDTAFKNAIQNGDKYLINMEINEWKDASYIMCRPSNNPSNGSMEVQTKDTVDVTIFVYDVKTKELINKQRLVGNGCPIILLNLIPIGTNSPEGYFEMLLNDWLNTL